MVFNFISLSISQETYEPFTLINIADEVKCQQINDIFKEEPLIQYKHRGTFFLIFSKFIIQNCI